MSRSSSYPEIKFFTIKCDVSCEFSVSSTLYQVEKNQEGKIPSIPSLLRGCLLIVLHEGVLDFVKCFFLASIEMLTQPLPFINVTHDIS